MLSIFDLLLTGAAAALWYVRPELGAWPLLLAAGGIAIRALARPQTAVWRRGPFDAPLALFLASALLSAALAYGQAPAWAKLWTIVGGLALYGSVAGAAEHVRMGRWQITPISVVLALFPVALGAYFLLTNDWARWAGKLVWLDPITAWLASALAAVRLNLPVHQLHPNVAGGLLAGLLPLQVAAVRRTRAGWALVAFSLLVLLLTASRGAWLALAVTAVGSLIGRAGVRRRLTRRDWPWLAVAAAGLLAVIPWLLLAADLSGPVASRVTVLRDSLALALDTPFTGLGLAGFQMAFSSYVLLLHVGHTIHSHNLFVNIWLEQGLLGLIAWGWLLVAAVGFLTRIPRPRKGSTPSRPENGTRTSADERGCQVWIAAALAALAVILLHGLVDDAFYGSRGVLLLFLPFAVLTRTCGRRTDGARTDTDAHGLRAEGRRTAGTRTDAEAHGLRRRRLSLTMVLAAVLLILSLLPVTRAAVQANLGALSQTRTELSVYAWPDWPIQDALRRQAPNAPPPVDLGPAIARYRAALALDPKNATANRRLGQIELSQGNYEAAEKHLEAAYAAAPWQRATRQLLAEAYAVTGQTQQAAELLNTVDLSQNQLGLRKWWYDAMGIKVEWGR